MTERAYPLPQPESGADPRFTYELTYDIGKLLAAAGYPPVIAGRDIVELQLALFRFIYEPEATHTDAGQVPTTPRGGIAVAEYDPGDPDYEVGTEAGNCPGCDGWHRPPWCADVAEPSEPEAIHALMSDGAELPRCGADEADDNGTGRYTDDQMSGVACAGCGEALVDGEPSVRVGHLFPGGGVVTDLGLSAHPQCTDMSIPELGDAP